MALVSAFGFVECVSFGLCFFGLLLFGLLLLGFGFDLLVCFLYEIFFCTSLFVVCFCCCCF